MSQLFRKVAENSFFYTKTFHTIELYRNFEEKIDEFYRQSYTGEIFFLFFYWLGTIFRNCFIGRLAIIQEDGNASTEKMIAGSIVFRTLEIWWAWVREKISTVATQSQSAELYHSIEKKFYRKPLQIGGALALFAVVGNSGINFLLGNDFSEFGVILRTILFLTSFFCLFSECEWRDLKETSYLVKKYLVKDY